MLQTRYITDKFIREDILPVKELIRSYLEGSGGESLSQAIQQFRAVPAKQ